MVKHIVMWRFKNESTLTVDAARVKQQLESLAGRIPGLLKIEVGVNFIKDANAADVVLYSEFTDAEALAGYQAHPLHLEIVPQVKALASERRSADYFV